MIIHRSFTGPTHLLSANVRGPVSFAVSVVLSGDKPFLSEPVSTKLSIDNYLMQCGTKATNEFLPKASFGLRVLSLPASVCLCVRPSVCVFGKHLLVRAITHHPFKLGSPNLDHRCKRPWLRSLLFWGGDWTWPSRSNWTPNQNLPHFELVHAMTHHQLKLQFPNLEQKCILALFRSVPILGLIEIDLQFNF